MTKASRASKGRILFVEDDQNTCILICSMLGLSGYDGVSASTVERGLKRAKEGGFDLILLDWYFDDGTGLELCKMIRSFDTETPIFFYTGVATDSKLENATLAGAQGFLVKPVELDKLLDIVTEYVLSKTDSLSGI